VEMYPISLNRASSLSSWWCGEMMVMRRGDRVVFAQVPLLKSQLDALKRRAGASTTKDALQAAVDHYLRCSATEEPEHEEEGEEEEQQQKEWWWTPERRQRA
jgi:hypothetical protein